MRLFSFEVIRERLDFLLFALNYEKEGGRGCKANLIFIDHLAQVRGSTNFDNVKNSIGTTVFDDHPWDEFHSLPRNEAG